MEAEFRRLGLEHVQYVHAAVPEHAGNNFRRNMTAEFGANLSHIKAVVRAIDDGAVCPLFIEDDIVFKSEIPLPPEYDVLYLGGHPREPVSEYGDGLYRVGTFSCAEAYSLSNPREFFDFWCDRIGKKNAMFDFILGEYAKQGLGLAYYPTITEQPPGHSQIGNKFDDKRPLYERGWQNNLPSRGS